MKATALPLHPVVGEEYAGIEHGKHHVEREHDGERAERVLHDLVLAADRVHGRAGGDGVVRADEVAEGSARVLTGKDGDGFMPSEAAASMCIWANMMFEPRPVPVMNAPLEPMSTAAAG